MSLRGEKNKGEKVVTGSGDTYGIGEILKENFAGIRYKTVNIPQKLKIGVSSISRNLSEDNIAFASDKRRSLSPEETQAAYNKYEQRYKSTFERASQFVTDGKSLGMTDDEIADVMKSGNLPSSMILGAISGVYTPPALDNTNPVTALYEQVERVPENQRRSTVEQLAKDNPTYAKTLISRYREDLKNKALNIGAVDKLILSQSEADGDRANFIYRKMQTLPDNLIRTVYLEDLKKKGIVTPAVSAQLNILLNPNKR